VAPQAAPLSQRRIRYGLMSAIFSGLLGIAVHASASWRLEAGSEQLVFFLLPGWTWTSS
jgi:hypothetical protein